MNATLNLMILSVEDDPVYAKSLVRNFNRKQMKIETCDTGEKALQMYSQYGKGHFNCALVDYLLPGMNGVQFIRKLRKLDDKIGIVLLSAFEGDKLEQECEGLSVWTVLPKTTHPDLIAEKVEEAYQLSTLPPEKEAEIGQAISEETKKIRAMTKDLLEETGNFPSVEGD